MLDKRIVEDTLEKLEVAKACVLQAREYFRNMDGDKSVEKLDRSLSWLVIEIDHLKMSFRHFSEKE